MIARCLHGLYDACLWCTTRHHRHAAHSLTSHTHTHTQVVQHNSWPPNAATTGFGALFCRPLAPWIGEMSCPHLAVLVGPNKQHCLDSAHRFTTWHSVAAVGCTSCLGTGQRSQTTTVHIIPHRHTRQPRAVLGFLCNIGLKAARGALHLQLPPLCACRITLPTHKAAYTRCREHWLFQDFILPALSGEDKGNVFTA